METHFALFIFHFFFFISRMLCGDSSNRMRTRRHSVWRLVTETAFEFRQLFGVEHMFDAIRSAIDQTGIEVGLSEQINLPQPVTSDGVTSFFGSARG